jgi:hypothetical protein
LEYVVPEWDAEWLLHVAARMESGQPLGPLVYDAAACFRQLAKTADAIKAINRPRPRTPGPVLRLNRAVHYRVRLRLLGRKQVKRARSEVAATWHTAAATIKDDYGDFGKEARRIIARIITQRQWESRDRDSVFEDLDGDMTDRAGWMSKSANDEGAQPVGK